MMRFRKIFIVLLAAVMAVSMVVPAAAVSTEDGLANTAAWLQKQSPKPTVSSIGGEWAVMGLARWNGDVPQSWFDTYYTNAEAYIKACQGVLHKRKYTEYARVVLAMTAIGKDATNVAGYDLTAPLNDYEKTVWQGINGPVWALIALDSGNYACTVRQKYIDYILEQELPQGGWALSGEDTDADMTGMTLQALAKYQTQPAVKAATDRALVWLSENQDTDGGFSTYGEATCESTAQVIVALCELGIDLEDNRFIKKGKSTLDALLAYSVKEKGFAHIPGGETDGMATEQAFYALVAAHRAQAGESSLYRMKGSAAAAFSDIAGHPNQVAIETLVAMDIVNGMGDGTFAPEATMTRAQFCTMVVKALELVPLASNAFSDVPAGQWYSGYVGAASANGIVNGVGGGKFNPNGTIIGQHAALMVNRAAKVLGVNHTTVNESAQPILRGEMAQMVYDLLEAAR